MNGIHEVVGSIPISSTNQMRSRKERVDPKGAPALRRLDFIILISLYCKACEDPATTLCTPFEAESIGALVLDVQTGLDRFMYCFRQRM